MISSCVAFRKLVAISKGTASNGREALNIYSAERDNISLVILDMSMPVMSGKECLVGLLKMDTKVRVLMVSGFMPEGAIKDALDLGAGGIYQKAI